MTTTPERPATLSALVAAEVRAWMGRLGVRQSELARRMGESDQWLSMRLRGRTPLDINEMQRIAQALGVSVHDLLPPREQIPNARLDQGGGVGHQITVSPGELFGPHRHTRTDEPRRARLVGTRPPGSTGPAVGMRRSRPADNRPSGRAKAA
jgi:transcriptional regulator with XRE-family HTH domain